MPPRDEAQWDFYECVANGVRSFVSLDLEARADAPQPERPYLVRVTCALEAPRADGLYAPTEGEALRRLGALVEGTLAERLDAVYVGRLIGGGRARHYFYANTLEGIEGAVEALTAAADYRLMVEADEDSGWREYLEFLYPNQLGWQYIGNRHVLERLAADGDLHDRPRPVDHSASFPREDYARDFAQVLGARGFQVEQIEEGDAGRWEVAARREHAVDLPSINEVTYGLVRLCEEFLGEYEGWGCHVQTEADDG